jgi:hypothetical protein
MISSLEKNIAYIRQHKIILVLTIVAFILTLLPSVFNGYYGCVNNKCGFIIGTNYRDGIWYLAVASTAFKSLPFRMPIFSGAVLQGYHFLPNFASYLLSYVGIPLTVSLYQLFPVSYMVLLTILSIILARKVKNDPAFTAIFLFFVFFGISFTIVTSLYHYGYIRNNMLINTFQSTRIFESPHVAFSFLILLGVLIYIKKKELSLKDRLVLGVLIFIAFGTKFYGAAVALLMLFLYEAFNLVSRRKLLPFIVNNAIYGIASLLAVIVFYNPFGASKGGSIFVFAPFSTVHHLIENPTLFHMPRLVLARYFLYEHGMSPRLLAIELFSVFLYVIYYFGTRSLGLIYLLKQIVTRKLNRFEAILALTVVVSIAFSVLFIQKGDWYNPIQFAVCASFLSNILAALLMYELLKSRKIILLLLFFAVILITFPSNLVNLGYIIEPARYVIPQKEMEALKFLKDLPDGPVLSPIFDPDMAYVSAFTGKQTYVNFVNVLENTGIQYKERERETSDVENLDVDRLRVRYFYAPQAFDKQPLLIDKCRQSKKYRQVFRNSEVMIFEKISD